MSIRLFENKESKKVRNIKRDDVRSASIDQKKIGPSLSDIRKPNLEPSKVEKMLEGVKARLLKEKEELETRKSPKGKGIR